jgi:hypothetical protein
MARAHCEDGYYLDVQGGPSGENVCRSNSNSHDWHEPAFYVRPGFTRGMLRGLLGASPVGYIGVDAGASQRLAADAALLQSALDAFGNLPGALADEPAVNVLKPDQLDALTNAWLEVYGYLADRHDPDASGSGSADPSAGTVRDAVTSLTLALQYLARYGQGAEGSSRMGWLWGIVAAAAIGGGIAWWQSSRG